MPYNVGISSGWWKVARDPSLLGLGTKAGSFGATTGIQFNQVDLDTVLEFIEPGIKEYVHRVKEKLGLTLGLHGEIGEVAMFESAERRRWDQSHERLCATMKGASDLGFIYVNFHLSNTPWLSFQEREIRPFGFSYQVVAPTGQPFAEFVEERIAKGEEGAKILKEWLKDKMLSSRTTIEEIRSDPKFEEERKKIEKDLENNERAVQRQAINNNQTLSDKEKEEVVDQYVKSKAGDIRENATQTLFNNRDLVFEIWGQTEIGKYILEAGEIDAYLAVAVYMIGNKESLWVDIVGRDYSNGPEDAQRAYVEKQKEFNAAVAAYYLYTHFTLGGNGEKEGRKDWNKEHINGMSIVKWCEEKDIMLLLECPQTDQGQEGISRLFHPLDAYHLINKISSSKVMQCIDFEQEMGQNIDLDKELPDFPNDFGKQVYLLHLGNPIPYFGTAHIPIALADRGADALYRWIYILKQKGFTDGYIIFERGSGRGEGKTQMNVFEYSVYVIRQIVKYLDQNVKPEALPPEFYGLSADNKDIYTQQLVMVREHAWDPLEGLLKIPEEKHGFLSKAAVDSNKAKEWDRARYR